MCRSCTQVSISPPLSSSSIQSGSEAQLNGELTRDFTSSCRAELLGLLLNRHQRQLLDDDTLLALLVSTDEEIGLLALEILASRTRSHHLVHGEKASIMFRELSRGWPPLDLLSCVSGECKSPGLWAVEVGNATVDTQQDSSSLGLFNRLVRQKDVPLKSRFGLLTRIRFARGFRSTETRHAYVKMMILAMQLQSERRLMRRQLRKLVKTRGNEHSPGSIRLLALETLTAYGDSSKVFSPMDRQRRVEDFMSGRNLDSFDSGLVEAMLRGCSIPVTIGGLHSHRHLPAFIISSASADNVLAWLEKEAENAPAADLKVLESLLLSRDLSEWLPHRHRDRLHGCLIKLFRNSELFGARVFNLAASLQCESVEAESAFMEAMLSVAIPSGWQVTGEKAIATFFSKMTPELEKKVIRIILSNVEMFIGSGSFLLRHPGFTASLVQAGGYEFPRQLPAGLVHQLPVADDVRGEIAGSWCREVEECSGDPEKLLEHLDGMMRLIGVDEFLRGPQGKKLVAMLEALAWPLTGVCLSILEQLVQKSSSGENIKALLDSVFGVHGDRFFLKLAAAGNTSESLMLAAWRHVDSDQRARVLACVLPDDLPPDPNPEAAAAIAAAVVVFTRLVSSRQDVRLVSGLGSKVLELLRALEPPPAPRFWPTSWLRALSGVGGPPTRCSSEYSGLMVRGLLQILNHMLELLDRDGKDLFAPSEPEEWSRRLRLEALAWYQSSLAQASRCCSGTRCNTVELLRVGEMLTRDYEVAQELLKSWKLPQLVDKLVEAGAGDRSGRSYATRTLSHLLEDERVLYRSMVFKVCSFKVNSTECTVKNFFTGLSSLAWRDPAVFLQASADTCSFNWDTGIVLLTLKVDQALRIRRLGESSARSWRLFHHLLAHLLRRLDDASLELLTSMLVELPVFVPAAMEAPGALERVLQGSYTSELVFSRFMNLVERHEKRGAVTRALLNAFSSPELDSSRLINMYKRLPRCWPCVSSAVLERILSSLKLLDLDHPEAEAGAASVVALVVKIFDPCLEKAGLTPRDFPGPEVSEASIKAFRSRVQQMQLASPFMAEAMVQPVEDVDMEWGWQDCKWSPTEEQLEYLGGFLWLVPRTGLRRGSSSAAQARLAQLLFDEDEAYISHVALSRVLLRMLQTPPPQRGFPASHKSINGVPEFVLRRVFHLHWRLVRRGYGMGYRFEEGTAVGFIPLLASAMKLGEDSRRLSTKLLEAIVLQLLHHGKSYSISLSGEELRNLCHVAVHTSDRLSGILVSLVSLDPALSPPFLSCVMELSTQVISSALELLERGDYSSCGAVARVTQLFEGLCGADAGLATKHLAPLWPFIDLKHRNGGKASGPGRRRLIQALLTAEALTTEAAPSERALSLLQRIASSKHAARLVKLALPMLRRWPDLKSVEFSTKLEFLRSSFVDKGQRVVLLHVSREHILRDAYNSVHRMRPEVLRAPGSIRVCFFTEPGYDAGGLRREFYQVVSRAIGKELFTESGNPRSGCPLDISYFRLAGRLVAKAIVDDQRLDVHFSRSLYKHLLGQEVTYLDMEDAQFLRSLTWVLQNHVDESLGLTFSVDVQPSPAQAQTTCASSHDLVAGGSDIPVTDANKHEYVKLLGEFLLTESIRPELDAFLDGFHELVPMKLISSFLPAELEIVICGVQDIDVSELKAAAKCKHDPQILEWFWETVAAFDHHHKSFLLAFATGSSKVPFGGVRKFLVGQMEGGDDYLPTAHTCISEILLPFYTTKESLERKLVLAIEEGRETFLFK